MDPRWTHPFTCVVAGPTGCGKTEWVIRFLLNLQTMVYPVPNHILWSYGEWQPAYHRLPPHVQWTEGVPDIPEDGVPRLIVIDDQMSDVDYRVSQLFTKGSHHRNVSVIYIVQNLFDQNKEHRTISLNTHYMVIFKNPRDGSQIEHLAKQMYPGHVPYVRDAFAQATKEAHGYLLVDLKQSTPDHLRLRSHIFPGELQEVYVEK